MKIVKETYKCDVCAKEYDKEGDLGKAMIPCYGEVKVHPDASSDIVKKYKSEHKKLPCSTCKHCDPIAFVYPCTQCWFSYFNQYEPEDKEQKK